MRRNKLLWIVAILIAVNFVVGMQVQEKLAGESKTDELSQLDLIPQAMVKIRNDYVDPVDTEKLVYGALRGMLNSLDHHSQFLPPVAVKNMEVDTSGTFGGLGIEITKKQGFITVVSPIVGTPAYEAGLMSGDRIVKINDEVLRDPDLNDVVSKLRGEPGTKVTLTILRGHTVPPPFTIARAIIKVPSIVEAKILEDSIGYVKVTQFQERTAPELNRELSELESQGMSALILDLRDNPGGLLVSAVEVADLFIPGGHVIVSTKGRRPAQNHEYRSRDVRPHPLYPLVVLINGASASGSEIVAGAIKDLKRGVIIGENSYGKGTVQTILRLGKPDQRMALRLTTAKYYTPSGGTIQGTGIEPHVVVPVTAEQELQRRTQKYRRMEKALDEGENEKPEKEGEEPSAEGEKPLIPQSELEKLTEEKTKEEGFVDIQLQEAVRILKAIKAIGGGSNMSLQLSAGR